MNKLRLFLTPLLLSIISLVNAQYILTLNFEQMDNFIGDQFEIRVTEIATGDEVGRKTIPSIDSVAFTVQLYVLLQGRSYQIDFYADASGNGSYDSPPIDYAWRRIVNNAVQDTEINFVPDPNYTDITFPPAFPYETYEAVWGGKWMNLTFGSTDSIQATFSIACDSIIGSLTTKGIFGNPNSMTFTYANARPPAGQPTPDTIVYTPDDPWTGQVLIIDEQVIGDINFLGAGLKFTGTIGAQQVLCLYEVILGGSTIANGYFYVKELEVLNSTAEIMAGFLPTDVTCFGDCDGSVDMTITGGLPPFSYVWNSGQTSEDLTDLCPGHYTVIITDSLGCSEIDSVAIFPAIEFIVEVLTTDVSCSGACDGEYEFLVGGIPPGTITWTIIESTAFCNGGAGNYTVLASNEFGCTAVVEFTIGSPPQLLIESLEIQHETNGFDGAITVTANGGIPPYTYSIGGAFQASNTFTGLEAGIYSVTVKDSNDCTVGFDITVQDLTAVEEFTSNFSFYPNPVSSVLHIHTESALSVEIMNMEGQIILEAPSSIFHQLGMESLPAGIYIMSLSDGKAVSYRKIIVQ